MVSSLSATPATPRQVRALICQFYARGYREREDRLASAAGALGIDGLGSFRELSRQQAGILFASLRQPDARQAEPPVAAARRPVTSAEPTELAIVTILSELLMLIVEIDTALWRRKAGTLRSATRRRAA